MARMTSIRSIVVSLASLMLLVGVVLPSQSVAHAASAQWMYHNR